MIYPAYKAWNSLYRVIHRCFLKSYPEYSLDQGNLPDYLLRESEKYWRPNGKVPEETSYEWATRVLEISPHEAKSLLLPDKSIEEKALRDLYVEIGRKYGRV